MLEAPRFCCWTDRLSAGFRWVSAAPLGTTLTKTSELLVIHEAIAAKCIRVVNMITTSLLVPLSNPFQSAERLRSSEMFPNELWAHCSPFTGYGCCRCCRIWYQEIHWKTKKKKKVSYQGYCVVTIIYRDSSPKNKHSVIYSPKLWVSFFCWTLIWTIIGRMLEINSCWQPLTSTMPYKFETTWGWLNVTLSVKTQLKAFFLMICCFLQQKKNHPSLFHMVKNILWI